MGTEPSIGGEQHRDSFTQFFTVCEPRLRQALSASLGRDLGRDATAEALTYGWEHWDRVESMDNPAGYLFVVGRNWGRRKLARNDPVIVPDLDSTPPWIEPDLPQALARLSERQRTAVILVRGFGWSLAEAAEMLGIAKASVQKHVERALERLARSLKVST